MIAAGLVFAASLAVSVRFGSRGVRAAILLAIVVAPLRGGLLEVFEDLPVGDADIFVNALGPALIAGAALGMLLTRRLAPARLPVALAYAWAALAVACALDFATQDVGLKLYAIGLAQYLAYPTLAIVLWFELREGEERRLADLLVGLGLLVCLTLFSQAAGITDFVQAVPAYVFGLPANRWAGITGSYLHTSAFLGPIAVLALGLALRGRDRRWAAISFVSLSVILSAQILTFSRSGVIISGLGVLALIAFSSMPERLRLIAVTVPSVAIALLAGTLGGVDPGEASSRISSGFNLNGNLNGNRAHGDAGNLQRTDAMKAAVRRYRDATLPKKALGEGIGSTGNARKLISEDPLPVESYYLKILLETGALGILLIVPFLIWATLAFGWRAFRARDPSERAIGAAGFAFSLHLVIYPTLEAQILSMAWWLLLALLLRTGHRPEEAGAFLRGARRLGRWRAPESVGA